MRKTSSSGVGIVNTRERLSKLYPDQKHSFTVVSNQPKGLRISITLPATYKNKTRSDKNISSQGITNEQN
jgi:sensor histidine kinase YesM